MMHFMRARRWAGGGRTAHVTQFALARCRGSWINKRLHLFFHKVPSAHVFGLFLYPENFGGIRVAAQDISQSLQGERIKLLHADNRDIVAVELFPLVDEIVVNFSSTQQDAADAVAKILGITDHFLERSAREFFQARGSFGITQQELGREDNQRLAYAAPIIAAVHLPAQ